MQKLITISMAIFLMVISLSVQAAEITVCIVDKNIKNNQTYFHAPNTSTKLRCEIDQRNLRPTLRELYRSGWQIIEIIEMGKGTDAPSPIIYLERSGTPVVRKSAPQKSSKNTKK